MIQKKRFLPVFKASYGVNLANPGMNLTHPGVNVDTGRFMEFNTLRCLL